MGGLTVIGLLWLRAAWKAAQGQRDYGNMVGRGLLVGGLTWLLWNEIYPDWGPLVVILLKGFYIAWLCSAVARFLLAAQLFAGRSAFDEVAGNIAAGAFDWNGPRRRRPFWQFWK